MPQIDQVLTNLYRGRTFDVAKAGKNEDWFNQGGRRPRRAAGLPRKRGVWVYSFVPLQGCCDHQFELILFVSLTSTGKVRQIKTGVYRSYSPTAIEEVNIEFFPHDLEHATKALDEVLTSDEAIRPRQQRRDVLDVAALEQLVGASIRRKAAHELLKRFRLVKAALGSEGFRYAAPRARLQVDTNKSGIITAVLLTPTTSDRVLEKPFELPGEPLKTIRRGHVRASLGLPTEASKRPNFDRFEYGNHDVCFSYTERGGAVAGVRISAVQSAC